MGSLLGHNDQSFSTSAGAPLIYGHSHLAAALGCEAKLEAFVVGSHTPLLSVVLANSSHRDSSDVAVAICLDITLEDACVKQCEQLLDEISKCWAATRADADCKLAVVIFACKGDLLDVDEKRWDILSAKLRLLALNSGAAFAVQSSSSSSATSRHIILAALQLASWPPPSLQRNSFFVPPSHDNVVCLRATLEVLDSAAPSLSSSSIKPLVNASLKPAHPVAPDDDQVGVRFCRVHAQPE